MAANPDDTVRLALDEEVRTIGEKLRGSTHAATIELVTRWAVRPDDLLQHLNELKPQIVHFSGHGTSRGELMLASDAGPARPVGAAALARVFALFRQHIQAVVLNACFSRVQAEAIVSQIDHVVGMSTEVGDEAARVFSGSFYRALGFGSSIREAFDQATTAILLADLGEENTPQLLTRADAAPPVLPVQPVPSEPAESVKRQVFMAYAPEDKPWLDRLQKHLAPHLHGRPITLWEAGRLQAGTRRRDELEQALTTAQAAILLVSADFLASEAITEHQLPKLLAAVDADRLAILPLVVGACAYEESPLEPFMALNDPNRPLEELTTPQQNKELMLAAQQIARVFREKLGW